MLLRNLYESLHDRLWKVLTIADNSYTADAKQHRTTTTETTIVCSHMQRCGVWFECAGVSVSAIQFASTCMDVMGTVRARVCIARKIARDCDACAHLSSSESITHSRMTQFNGYCPVSLSLSLLRACLYGVLSVVSDAVVDRH